MKLALGIAIFAATVPILLVGCTSTPHVATVEQQRQYTQCLKTASTPLMRDGCSAYLD